MHDLDLSLAEVYVLFGSKSIAISRPNTVS